MASQPPEVAQRLLGNGKGWGVIYLAAVVALSGGVNWWFSKEAEQRLAAIEADFAARLDAVASHSREMRQEIDAQIRRELTLELDSLEFRLEALRTQIETHSATDEADLRRVQQELSSKVDQGTRLEMKAGLERRMERIEDRLERLENRVYRPMP